MGSVVLQNIRIFLYGTAFFNLADGSVRPRRFLPAAPVGGFVAASRLDAGAAPGFQPSVVRAGQQFYDRRAFSRDAVVECIFFPEKP